MQQQKEKTATATAESVETQEQFGPMSVTKMQMNGITEGDIKKLQDAGLHTIESVA